MYKWLIKKNEKLLRSAGFIFENPFTIILQKICKKLIFVLYGEKYYVQRLQKYHKKYCESLQEKDIQIDNLIRICNNHEIEKIKEKEGTSCQRI